MTIDFILNGEDVSVQAKAGDRLSELLRGKFGLSRLHSDCLCGRCGRCIVLLNGRAVNSCLVPAFRVRGSEVVTNEGFAMTEEYRDVREGFEREGLECCGFCEASRELVASAVVDDMPGPSDSLILERMSAIECRCVQPSALLRAVRAVSEIRERRLYSRADQ